MLRGIAKCRAHSAISVAAVIQFKDICDGNAHTGILVGSLYPHPVIEVGATPQFSKELRQRVSLFQGINQRRLLPIRQELRVDAQAFFYYFIGLLQDVVFDLELSNVSSE
ncbi:hypothetical protein WR30_18795 [Burkholderia contaminans FFH2055]|nr:hypothetical protein WR30_18795 [Burkholderia contaminans FFH2055]